MKTLLIGQIVTTVAISAYHAVPLGEPLAPRHTFVSASAFAFTASAIAFGVVGVRHLFSGVIGRSGTEHQGISSRNLKAKCVGIVFLAAAIIAAVDLFAAYARALFGLIVIALAFATVTFYAIDAADNRRVRRGTILSLTIQTLAILITALGASWIPSAIGAVLLAALYAVVSKNPRRFGLSIPDRPFAWR